MKFISPYEAPWADSDELFTLDVGTWKYQKPVTKASKCCHCGICFFFCPTGCVGDMGDYFAADLDYCKGCGICEIECPVSAISMERI